MKINNLYILYVNSLKLYIELSKHVNDLLISPFWLFRPLPALIKLFLWVEG